ncbi:MAG: methyltransferase type 11, partial [Pseudomonadota bacterium]
EFDALFRQSGLVDCTKSGYGVPIELETQLRASFPDPEDVPTLREMVTRDIGVDRLGIAARREGGEVVYTVPVAVYVGRKLG